MKLCSGAPLVDVPARLGVRGYLDGPLARALAALDLADGWASDAAAALLPLKLERAPRWDRRARAPCEPGVGALRVYPDFAGGTFDDVLDGQRAFLPPE